MNYEKKYKDALERARKVYNEIINNDIIGFPEQITDIFPELAESEDERIRKEIISALKFANDDGVYDKHIAYLEKQKEMPTNEEMLRTLRCEYEKGVADTIAKYEQKEQKPEFYPGDVIKCTSTGSLWVRCKDRDNIRSDGHTACIGGGFELASEEEAVQFFQELNENGYQWDCIKGRPMKKEQKLKQEWSEKDESMFTDLRSFFLGDRLAHNPYDVYDWLKSIHPQSHWKPSEEQIEALMLAIEGDCPPTSYMSRRLEDLYEGLANTFKVECKLKED